LKISFSEILPFAREKEVSSKKQWNCPIFVVKRLEFLFMIKVKKDS